MKEENVDIAVDNSRMAKRLRIYRFLLEGNAKSRVAKIIKTSRQSVHSITQTLVRRGIVEPIPQTWPRQYRRGTTAASFEKASIRYGHADPRDVNARAIRMEPAVKARYHGAAVRFRITALSRARLDGWRSWTAKAPKARSGTSMARTNVSVAEKGYRVEIRGRANPILIIYLPEAYVNSVEAYVSQKRRMAEEAMAVARECVHLFNIAIDPTPILHQKPEIAFEDDRGLLALSRECLFRLNGYAWTDGSKGFPEFETADFEIGLLAFAIPRLLRSGRLRWSDSVTDNPHPDGGKQ